MKNKLLILLLLGLTLLVSSCKTKEVPGRRRTPRNCNSCTKWSYIPSVNGIDTLTFQRMSFRPTKEGENLCAERFGMTSFPQTTER